MARAGRRRTGRKILAGLLVLVVLLLVVGVVLDRVALSAAESKLQVAVTNAARESNVSPETTDVRVEGFPFLTQVVAGRFDGGRIQLVNVTTPVVRVDSIAIDVRGITMPTDVLLGEAPHDIRAATVRGTAALTVTEVARGLGLQGLTLSSANGKLQVETTVSLPSVGSITIAGEVRPAVKGNRFWLEVDSLQAGDVEVPRSVLNSVTRALGQGFVLPLPFQIDLDDVRVSGGQILVDASARNVLLVQ